MTSTDLPKTFDPAAVERETYDTWLRENCFVGDPSSPGEPYSIVIPPPNVTGALHLGHAINTTLQDILIRQHRMRGFNTVWIPGIDHAGIATQAVVEKRLKEDRGLDRHQIGREGLVEEIWKWKQQFGDRILAQLQRLGCSCDWSRTRFTLDEMCARAVRETFFKLFRDGLVYRGKRLVNWDTHLQTSISDDEIYHENVKTFLWHIKYKIVTAQATEPNGSAAGSSERGIGVSPMIRSEATSLASNEEERFASNHEQDAHATFMTVATTRPETLLGDTAVAVHSQDPRWNWAIGMAVELPLTGRKIPIIADDILVDPTFGSGVVKVTPAHDPNDYAVWQRHQNQPDQIDIINLMNPDGTLNAAAGKYEGLTMPAARKKLVEDLGDDLIKEEPYETQIGHSDRSKTAIQPYLSDQWFVKMAPLAEPALEVVRNGTIKFFPERHAQQYLSWLGEKRDWPISRQLWWGHRIPVWSLYLHAESGGPLLLTKLSDYFEEIGLAQEVFFGPSDEDSNHIVVCTRSIKADRAMEAMNCFYHLTGTKPVDPNEYRDVVRTEKAWELARSIMDGPAADPVVRDPDVLDTWFSSALWPHSTLGWPEQTSDLAKWYPTSVLMTGRDIITLWVARMVMMGMYNLSGTGVPHVNEKPSAALAPSSSVNDENPNINHVRDARATFTPFKHVAINPTILDGKGERMSKSKGNGVDPVDIIDTHGADALRFTLTTMATETQDVRLPVKKNAEGKNTSDKFDLGRNFATKLWNAARFALSNLETNPPLAPRSAGVLAEPDTSPTKPPQSGGLMEGNALANRWILSRLNKAVSDANTAIDIYRFDQYATGCYDFFWRDLCDWYLEAIKPAMRCNDAATANTLAAILDGTLRLLHPMIPFITERLWWELNRVRPERGITGLPCPPSERLIKASWPTHGEIDSSAESDFAQLQQIITSIRNVRSEHNVDQKKTVPVIAVGSTAAMSLITSNLEWIQPLATCTITTDGNPPADAVRALAGEVELFIHGVTDPAAEAQRRAKQCESLTKQATALRNRLANPSYASKAPAHLVQQTREELATVEAELSKLRCGTSPGGV